ncbi:MAG: hypothetical protein NT039_01705, partial [Candidatus Berkelbacteria bacterium]|nr:hypothetical protein [Candidatus Berkelbacteria bacterium]
MDYFGIVKKAIILPWKYRFLFWLGVLATFASGGGGSGLNYSGNSANFQDLFNKQKDESSILIQPLKNIAPRVLGESTNRFQDWLSSYWFVIALVILVLLLVFITLWIFGMFARAGIIRSVPRLEKGESSNFFEALWDGKRFFWRFIGATVLLVLFFLVLIGVLVGIAIPLFLISVIVGFIWLVPAIIIFIIVAIYVGIIAQFWLRHIVIEDKGVIATLIP